MKAKTFDCVEIKRRAQRGLREALAGKSPEEQAVEIARRAKRNPIWLELLAQKEQPKQRKRAAGR
jgi:hypothetical protein